MSEQTSSNVNRRGRQRGGRGRGGRPRSGPVRNVRANLAVNQSIEGERDKLKAEVDVLHEIVKDATEKVEDKKEKILDKHLNLDFTVNREMASWGYILLLCALFASVCLFYFFEMERDTYSLVCSETKHWWNYFADGYPIFDNIELAYGGQLFLVVPRWEWRDQWQIVSYDECSKLKSNIHYLLSFLVAVSSVLVVHLIVVVCDWFFMDSNRTTVTWAERFKVIEWYDHNPEDLRADSISLSDLKHTPKYAKVLHTVRGKWAIFPFQHRTTELIVSLEVVSQLSVASNLSPLSTDEITAERIFHSGRTLQSVNLDRYLTLATHNIVQDSAIVVFGLYRRMCFERRHLCLPRATLLLA